MAAAIDPSASKADIDALLVRYFVNLGYDKEGATRIASLNDSSSLNEALNFILSRPSTADLAEDDAITAILLSRLDAAEHSDASASAAAGTPPDATPVDENLLKTYQKLYALKANPYTDGHMTELLPPTIAAAVNRSNKPSLSLSADGRIEQAEARIIRKSTTATPTTPDIPGVGTIAAPIVQVTGEDTPVGEKMPTRPLSMNIPSSLGAHDGGIRERKGGLAPLQIKTNERHDSKTFKELVSAHFLKKKKESESPEARNRRVSTMLEYRKQHLLMHLELTQVAAKGPPSTTMLRSPTPRSGDMTAARERAMEAAMEVQTGGMNVPTSQHNVSTSEHNVPTAVHIDVREREREGAHPPAKTAAAAAPTVTTSTAGGAGAPAPNSGTASPATLAAATPTSSATLSPILPAVSTPTAGSTLSPGPKRFALTPLKVEGTLGPAALAIGDDGTVAQKQPEKRKMSLNVHLDVSHVPAGTPARAINADGSVQASPVSQHRPRPPIEVEDLLTRTSTPRARIVPINTAETKRQAEEEAALLEKINIADDDADLFGSFDEKDTSHTTTEHTPLVDSMGTLADFENGVMMNRYGYTVLSESLRSGFSVLSPKISGDLLERVTVKSSSSNTDMRGIAFDDLETLGRLGSGAGGVVTKVLHRPSDTLMAVKTIPLVYSPEIRTRITRELRLMHRTHCESIVKFRGAFFSEGNVQICMEWMDAGNLRSLYVHAGAMPEGVVATVAIAILSGLHYLKSELNVMHRDVKPENVLLSMDGNVKLCDLGVSANLVHSFAKTVVGTQLYFSPERLSHDSDGPQAYSVAADVWCMGLTLMEMALGRFPYPVKDDAEPRTKGAMPPRFGIIELMHHFLSGATPDLPASRFSPECREFVRGCLEKDPSKRSDLNLMLRHPFITKWQAEPFDMAGWLAKVYPDKATERAADMIAKPHRYSSTLDGSFASTPMSVTPSTFSAAQTPAPTPGSTPAMKPLELSH